MQFVILTLSVGPIRPGEGGDQQRVINPADIQIYQEGLQSLPTGVFVLCRLPVCRFQGADMRLIQPVYEGIDLRMVRPAVDIKEPGVVEIAVSHPRSLAQLRDDKRNRPCG